MSTASRVFNSRFEAVSYFDAISSHLMGLSRYFLDVVHTIAYRPN
jgi:hypothetical protein